MNLGDIARVLGIATVSGLGTAEEQRTRADKAAALAQAAQVRREDLAFREKQLAETVRQHRDTLGLQREQLAETIRRNALQYEGVPLGQLARDVGLELPEMRTTVPVQAPGEAGLPNLSDITPTTVGTATIRDLAAEGAREQHRYPTAAIGTVRDLLKEKRERTTLEQLQKDKAEARRRFLNKEPMETILADYPRLIAKDVAGYELAAPEKAPSLMRGEDGELILPTPGEGPGFKVLRPGQPNEKKAVDLDIAKMRRDNMRAVQNAGNIVEAILAGQDVPIKEVRLHLSTLRPIRTQYRKDAEESFGDPEQKAFLVGQVRDIDRTMKILTDYLSGKRPGGGGAGLPRIPGESPVDRVKKKWGIK